uniref:Flavin-containing monooxygenase n=1 Tax=Aegilops tauschii subsp. strangulata TaxID=200361 RepID=A0A453NJH2_AEGTS
MRDRSRDGRARLSPRAAPGGPRRDGAGAERRRGRAVAVRPEGRRRRRPSRRRGAGEGARQLVRVPPRHQRPGEHGLHRLPLRAQGWPRRPPLPGPPRGAALPQGLLRRVRAHGGCPAQHACPARRHGGGTDAAVGGEVRTRGYGGGGEEVFDAVVVANGHYSQPRLPSIQGMEAWRGRQMHNHPYRLPEPFRGDMVVVVVGCGASDKDIAMEVRGHSYAVMMLSVMSLPGTKADCSSETISGNTTLRRLEITFEAILYNTLHKLIGRNCDKSVGFFYLRYKN